MTKPTSSGGLIVFLRLPQKGKVKTRLAEKLGDDKAFAIYEQLVKHTLATVRKINWPVYFFYDGGLPAPSEQLSSAHYFLQAEGDLGQRMQQAFSLVLKNYSKAVIIGSDCPGLTGNIIDQAFASLVAHEVAIGPAVDGGYYLLGCKKLNPILFDDIQWSSASVLTETIRRCAGSGLSYALLPQLRDVDTLEDYLLLQHELESE